MALTRFRGCFQSSTATTCQHQRCESARMGVWWCERSHRLNPQGQCGTCDDYVVTKGIKMPEHRAHIRDAIISKYPFAKMEVGESFGFPRATCATVSVAAAAFGRRHGWKFAVRGARVWRVA